MTTKLIIGLGNPKLPEFEKTRHNLGKRVIERAAEELKRRYGISDWERKDKLMAEISQGKRGSTRLIFAKPLVYMNESGKTIGALTKFFKIKSENVLVVHDDSDIIFGKMKLSFGSRSAGHRGVESVIRALKTKNFWRLRVGIRPPREEIRRKAEELILEHFTNYEEQKLKNAIFPKATETIRAWIDK